jgi:hypothetical protein
MVTHITEAWILRRTGADGAARLLR